MIHRLRLIRQRRQLRKLERGRAMLIEDLVRRVNATATVPLGLDSMLYTSSMARVRQDLRELESIARYQRRLARERYLGLTAVSAMTREWRRELWPDPAKDPIAREDPRRQLRQQLVTEAYWGAGLSRRPMYGGICGA